MVQNLGADGFSASNTGNYRELLLEFGFVFSRAVCVMLDNDFISKLSQRLTALLPMAGEIRDELRTKIEQQLQASFAGLDLLTRADFDAQAEALRRAEQRVLELEALLAGLDARLEEIESRIAAK